MKIFSKIIDEQTKRLSCVVCGDEPVDGYSLLEREMGYDGEWYLKGYTPEKPQEIIKKERIAELKQLLADSDYKGQKYLDGEYTEEEWQAIVAERKAWREEIRELSK